MPIPRLIHPVPVELRQIDKPHTIYDADANEPVQHAAHGTLVKIKGQVSFVGGADGISLVRTKGGPQAGETGYVLFRYKDLVARGVTLRFNDRITSLGSKAVDLYVTRVQDAGHYPDRKGSTIVRAWFSDRQPQKGVGVVP